MSMLDANAEFADSFAITTSAASSNVMDLGPLASGNTYRNIGVSKPLFLYGWIEEAVTSTASATVAWDLQTSSTTAFTSPTTVFTTGAIAKATLVAGYEFVKVQLPIADYKRYIRLFATITQTCSAGTYSASITAGVPAWTGYARAGTDSFGA